MDEPIVPVVPVVPDVVTPVATVVPELAPVLPEPVVEVPKPEPTGNDFFDMVQDVLHEKGVAPQKYWAEVQAEGKVTPESRIELVAALGEAQVKIIESGLTQELTKLSASQEAEAQKVYDAVALPGYEDGKAAFGIISEWSKTNVSVEERATFNEMLSKGGVQANLAVKALKDRYMADPSYTAAGTLVGGTGVPAAPGPELISRATYTVERRKAANARDEVAIQKLDARARASMATSAWRP